MSRRWGCSLAAVAAMVLAGCAPTETREEEATYRAPVYRTGSNLPAGRETGQASNRELSAAERKLLDDMQNRGRQPPPGLSK